MTLPVVRVPTPVSSAESPAEAAEAVAASPAADEAVGVSWPDDAAESAFLAEARDRGEPVRPSTPAEDVPEETDPKSLPALDELVKRISPEIRETLEELFRARFVTVKRLPKKAFKSQQSA